MLGCNMIAHDVRCPSFSPFNRSHDADTLFSLMVGSSGSLSRQVTTSTSNGRRRSQVLMNLQHNDPSLPGPGEMVSDHGRTSTATSPPTAPLSTSPLMIGGDPHHNRAPSLGELHQELEAEQEAQVNRLLLQIRQQQAQILHLQHNQPNQSAIIGEESPGQMTPAHPGAQPIAAPGPPSISASGSLPRSPIFPRGSFEHGSRADFRHRSRTPSRGASPRLRSTSISQDSGEPLALGGSNESAFYQAETQMLTRENQMLRHRIRDLGGSCNKKTTSVMRSMANFVGNREATCGSHSWQFSFCDAGATSPLGSDKRRVGI